MPDEITGVEETIPAAGEQEESEDLFDYLGEEEGDEEDETDAGSETEDEEEEESDEEDEVEEEDDDKFDDPKTEKAFAKRLAAREAKLRTELRDEILDEVRKQSPQPQYQQPVTQATIKEQVDKLADDLAITPEAAQILYQQQLMINQLYGRFQQTEDTLAESRDVTTKSQAKLEVETKRAANSLLPEFDEDRLTDIRKKYQKNYGVNLPWQEAYNFLVAEEAMSGKFNRKVQQETLKKVGKRQKKTVQVKTTAPAKKPTLDALSDEQFERMVERAKAGDFKKS